jgi:hypothetical protein
MLMAKKKTLELKRVRKFLSVKPKQNKRERKMNQSNKTSSRNELSREYQKNIKRISKEYQGNNKGISREYQGNNKGISKEYQRNIKGITREYQKNIKRISRE